MVFEIQVLDLKNWTWSRVETKIVTESQETSSPATLTHCAGHSLVCILTRVFVLLLLLSFFSLDMSKASFWESTVISS